MNMCTSMCVTECVWGMGIYLSNYTSEGAEETRLVFKIGKNQMPGKLSPPKEGQEWIQRRKVGFSRKPGGAALFSHSEVTTCH